MSPHLSRHVDNDDPRHFAFIRDSKIPHGTFADPLEWCTRRAVRWSFIALLIVGVAVLAWLGDGGMPNW